MSTLKRDFRSMGTELPLVALVRVVLAPTVCLTSLGLCLFMFSPYEEAFAAHYAALAIGVLFVSAQVFGELPLANQPGDLSAFVPGRAIITKWLIAAGILLFAAFAFKLSELYSRKVVLSWFLITPFALQFAQTAACRALRRFAGSTALPRSRVIVGLSDTSYELAREIEADPCLGGLKGFFDDRQTDRTRGVKPGVLGALAQVTEYVKRNAINVVYITLPMSQQSRVVELLDGLRDTTASIYFVPARLPFDFIQARIDHIGTTPVIAVCETPFYGLKGVLKRAFDLIIAGTAILATWPLMIAIALGVKATSPGPVLFNQRRYGLGGKEIVVYKFRSMTTVEDGECVAQAKKNDPRVTPFGKFLRKTSLDELPQFFNVLAGTMSIVGPRPHAVAHNEQYRALIDGYMLRYKVKPGITGWAQINGFRGETETVAKMRTRIEYDLDYLRHWSLSLDLWIVLRTAFVVVKDSQAY